MELNQLLGKPKSAEALARPNGVPAISYHYMAVLYKFL